MIQADQRSNAVGAMPSTGKIDEISSRLSSCGGMSLGEIERNDVYYALGMIDARALALRQMLELVRASRDIDDAVRGLLDVVAFEIAEIEGLADERLRERTIQ